MGNGAKWCRLHSIQHVLEEEAKSSVSIPTATAAEQKKGGVVGLAL